MVLGDASVSTDRHYGLVTAPQKFATFNASLDHSRFKDLSELRRFMQRYIDLWDRDRGRGAEIKVEYAEGSGPVIWALANHSVELSRTILLLSEQNRLAVAVPLIRLLIENMITGIWLYLSPDSARSLVHEGLRNRVAAIREVIGHGAAGFTQETLDEWTSHLDEFEPDASEEGRKFEKRCKAIVDGPGVYTTWRMASTLSHAGTAIGDLYLVATERSAENPLGVALNPGAILPSHEAWLGTSVCTLLGSMKTFDLISTKGRFKNQIADGAKRMGIGLEFKLVER